MCRAGKGASQAKEGPQKLRSTGRVSRVVLSTLSGGPMQHAVHEVHDVPDLQHQFHTVHGVHDALGFRHQFHTVHGCMEGLVCSFTVHAYDRPLAESLALLPACLISPDQVRQRGHPTRRGGGACLQDDFPREVAAACKSSTRAEAPPGGTCSRAALAQSKPRAGS